MTPNFLLIPLLLLLLLSTPTTTTADIVIDSEKNPIVSGKYYYAFSLASMPVGSGISMFNGGTLCWACFLVTHSNVTALDLGIPIKLTPEISRVNNTVHTSSNLNIAFEFLRPKPSSRYTTVWTVSENTVVLNGEERSDGSWFKLESPIPELATVYSILHGDKTVLCDQHPNGQIMLGLEKGSRELVTFVPLETSSTTLSDSLKMSHLRYAQELLANNYNAEL